MWQELSVRNPHSVLGISPNATPEEAKKAYRRLARKYHPDVSKEPNAEEKFKEVQAAYDAIKNPQKHQEQVDFSDFGMGGFDDFLRAHFGMGQQQRRRVAHTQISLEECFRGTTRIADGIQINIPAGVRSGTQLLLDNSIVIIVNVSPHHTFQRNNDDLLVGVELSMPQAIFGCEVHIKHLSGSTIHAKIPAGVQAGQVIRLSGKGLPNPQIPNRRGDLFLQMQVRTPDKNTLTDDQKSSIMSIGYQNIKTI